MLSISIPIAILVIVFIVLIISDTIHYLLSAGILFMFYMWGLIAFDMTVLQKIFYPLGIVFFIATKAAFKSEGGEMQTNASHMDVNASRKGGIISGVKYHAFSIIIGIAMLGMMFILSGQKGQFLGVSHLAITGTGFSAWITAQCSPAISMALGFIENRMFIAWLNILLLSQPAIIVLLSIIPILGALAPLAMILPIFITAITFGLFHIVAYNVVWSLIWWAAMIMVVWIISYYLTGKDTTAMDTAHGGWNGILTTKETLSIAF